MSEIRYLAEPLLCLVLVRSLGMEWTFEELAEAVRPRTKKAVTHDPDRHELTILDAEARENDVLISFRWKRYPYVLAMGVGPDSDYGDVDSPEGWAADAATFVMVELDTGRAASAERQLLGDFIELGPGAWPDDDRFCEQTNDPLDNDPEWRDIFDDWRDPLVDPTRPLQWREDGTLIAWHWTYLNNRYGAPLLGHTATRWVGDGVASLAYLDVGPELPDMVQLQLALVAVHVASYAGAHTVTTELESPMLEILGFHQTQSGRQVDTRFLDTDLEAARALQADAQRWRKPDYVRRAVREASRWRHFAR